jgi:hypothetical protein
MLSRLRVVVLSLLTPQLAQGQLFTRRDYSFKEQRVMARRDRRARRFYQHKRSKADREHRRLYYVEQREKKKSRKR